MAIFNFFGSILGYLLWFLYTIFRNYGVAIILFTIILKLVMFPTSIKQQKSMASQAKLAEKQKELQKKYANNRQKYNDELTKLYEKEGVSPTSGCLTTLLPFPIMLGIYYSVVMPLSNTLHIAGDTVAKATEYISKIPGAVSVGGFTAELEIIRNFNALRDSLTTIFSPQDVEKIDFFLNGFSGVPGSGFKFLGLDLLATPKGAPFSTFLWLIPVLSLLSSVAFQVYTMWYQKKTTGQKQQGCMVVMMFLLPLISVYWAYSMPAAVGFYWVMSGLANFVQSVITNKYFSVNHMLAMTEARRAVTLELAEASARPLPVEAQKQIADRLSGGAPTKQNGEASAKKQASKKKKSGASGDASAYRGAKK